MRPNAKPISKEALIKVMLKLGWSQTQVAKYLRVSQGQVSRYLDGSTKIDGPVRRLVEELIDKVKEREAL